jgi:hypothetical protein
MSKPKILYVTQPMEGKKKNCGIGIMGDLIGSALQQNTKYEFKILYADWWQVIIDTVNTFNPDVIIYNYAPGTTPWMDMEWPRNTISVPQIRMMHDMHQKLADEYIPENHAGWQYIIADDPSVIGNDHVFVTNRLIPDFATAEYEDIGVPIIGFQGFGAPHKGLLKLAHQIQKEFDEAVFRVHMPFGYYEDLYWGREGSNALARAQELRECITNPNIKLEISHDMLPTADIVNWLAKNTINCYFYDYLDLCGLASSPDYALASKRPIALSKSYQFRHFWGIEPSIFIEDKSIKEIIEQGTAPLEYYYKAYSKESVINDYDSILQKILCKNS